MRLEYYKKNYKPEDQNVGVVIAILDPNHPSFEEDIERLNQIRTDHRNTFYYFLVSLRDQTFEEARDIINSNMTLSQMNVI